MWRWAPGNAAGVAALLLVSASASVVPIAAARDASGPVAVVGTTPISLQSYKHWSNVDRRAIPREPAKARRSDVMNFLISNTWIENEAAADGIVVTDQQVTQEVARLRRENFKTKQQFQRFLRHAGESVSDLRYRTRIDLLSARVESRVPIADVIAKWKAQTKCAPAYVASDCAGTLP